MKTVTLDYKSQTQLLEFIQDNNIQDTNYLLVQVFTAMNNEEDINNLRTEILEQLPNAKIIGATTCGEISNEGSISNSTVISFSTFEKTVVETKLLDYRESSFVTGQSIIKSFENTQNEELKLIITFSDGLNTNGEEYLAGISSINEEIVISGGMAGDNATFTTTYIFNEVSISSHGAVAAALFSDDLNVYTNYSFNWETIGKKHIVEKSDKNRVYRIGGMTTVEFYKYYLGNDMDRLLPAIGIEFPLVMTRGNVKVARAVLIKHDDGSLSFAGNIPEGSEIQFGHGSVQMIIHKGLDNVKNLLAQPIESIFIYSCMARRALLQEDVNLELLPLREIAPISGFFTYGEFYHNCTKGQCANQLLNETMTILAISESKDITNHINPNVFSHNPPEVDDIGLHRTQALSILIERTTKELESLNNDLESRVTSEVEKNIEKDNMLQMIQAQAQLGDMIEMILHQWRQPLSAISTAISSTQVYKMSGILKDDMLDKTLIDVMRYVEHLNDTVEDFRDLFKAEVNFTNILPTVLIQKSLTILYPLLKIHGIKVESEFESDEIVLIPINLMMQVIINIVKNAIDILIERKIENPIVKFKTYVKKERLIIKIMDNAGGIPEDILPYIFNKKFTTKSDTHGTGIGLDMSKNIVENKVGGKLTANNVGEWAVFNIKIPRKAI